MILKFARSSMLYDIANYAYIEAHRLEIDDDSPVRAHLLSDITAEGNVDRVSRVLALVAAETQCLVHYEECTEHSEECTGHSDECIEWAPDIYEISLPASSGLCGSAIDLLYRLIHEYMVCRVIYDWLSIAHSAYGAPWQEKAEAARTQIIDLLGRQRRVHRRPISPW